jgi:hypothetical protein
MLGGEDVIPEGKAPQKETKATKGTESRDFPRGTFMILCLLPYLL